MPITHPEQNADFELIFYEEKYQISKCLFGLYSYTFRQHPSFVFNNSLDMSEEGIGNEIFYEFVKACQGKFYTINIDNCFGLLQLCEKWEAKEIKAEVENFISKIDECSSNILKLKFLLSNVKIQMNDKGRNEEIESIEDPITKHINSYLKISFFASLPMSSLSRIIFKSFSYKKLNENSEENFEYEEINDHLFLKFLKSVTKYHKEASRVFINLIDDFGKMTSSEIKEINHFANPFSKNEKLNFLKEIDEQNVEIDNFQKEIDNLIKQEEKTKKKIKKEVKTLQNSIINTVKNSPTSSKSMTNLAAAAAIQEHPAMANSTSEINLNSKSKCRQESDSQIVDKISDSNNNSNLNSNSNSPLNSIIDSLNKISSRFAAIKEANASLKNPYEHYNAKFDELSRFIDELNRNATKPETKPKQKVDGKSSLSSSEKKNSASQSFKGLKKSKKSNQSNEQNVKESNETPMKINFQVVKKSQSRKSLSVKEPDSRFSLKEKSGAKHSYKGESKTKFSFKKQQPSPSALQEDATVSAEFQGVKTILFSQESKNSFAGLISYLKSLNASGSFHGNLSIDGSSFQSGNSKPAEVLNSSGYWLSSNLQNQWISFDFISRKINVVNYSIKSIPYPSGTYHLKNWVLEGSDIDSKDDNDWILIDKKEDNSQLNDTGAVATFDVSNRSDMFFRYIRLRSIGNNHCNTYHISLAKIEFFGTLKMYDNPQ